MSSPERSIVIPSWNGAAPLRAHLPSVLRAAANAAPAEVVVFDDGSDDGTEAILAAEFPGVRVVRSALRGGFAQASNGGIAAAVGRTIVLLNNDMEVGGDTVARLSSALELGPEIFATVPSIVRSATGREEALTRIRLRRGVVSTDIDGADGSDAAALLAWAPAGGRIWVDLARGRRPGHAEATGPYRQR